MISFDRSQLRKSDAEMLNDILSALAGQPDKVIFSMLVANPIFRDCIEYRDDSILDKVDELANNEIQQLRLMELHEDMVLMRELRARECFVTIDLSSPEFRRDEDHLHHKIVRCVLQLSQFPRFLAAEEEYEQARGRLSAEWDRMIPESLIPKVLEVSPGGRGYRRYIPAWDFRGGKIVCRRD